MILPQEVDDTLNVKKLPQSHPVLSAGRLDPRLLERLSWCQSACLLAVGCICIAILVAWASPAFAALFPMGWNQMRPDTALLALLSALSLALSQPKRSHRSLLAGRVVAVFVLLPALTIFLEYAFQATLRIDPLLDGGSVRLGRMSPQSAAALAMLGLVMLLLRTRGRILAPLADGAVLLQVLLTLMILSGYLFGAVFLFGQSMQNRTSPHTLLSLILLTFVAYTRRAEYGVHSVLLGIGIGGRLARITLPLAIFLPLLLEAIRAGAIHLRLLGPSYDNAIAASTLTICILIVILMVARRTDTLEARINDLSLRDPLTGIYNRRGVYVLGEQTMRLARRSGKPFSVVFLDLDRLKYVNDSLGHEAGSEFLATVAGMLTAVFRESDVVGRVGGDEFVVAGEASAFEMNRAVQRLDASVVATNASSGRLYSVSFSVGCATRQDQSESFEELLVRADEMMYDSKRRKRIER